VEEVKAVHYKQLLSYLRLTNKQVGLLVNFNVDDIMSGIKRVVNHYNP
ncbi:MAG: GxxExxY protein, partial [Bacteroidaceae bacterium]|nr:GxxExxY protein [Bacteroidaceae bacterium]